VTSIAGLIYERLTVAVFVNAMWWKSPLCPRFKWFCR